MLTVVQADEEHAAQALRAQATAQRSQLLQAKEAREQQKSLQNTKEKDSELHSASKQAKKTK